MRDIWYADNRDLVKWGVLLRLAGLFECGRILQLAFYRPGEFDRLVIDGREYDIPLEVISHFRNLRTIGSLGSPIRVTVFDPILEDRAAHLEAVLALLAAFAQERCLVFLDPDTGLEPRTPGFEHVLASEARAIWDRMKSGDLFVFYQHQTNRAGRPWIETKQSQLADALGLPPHAIKTAHARKIAQDVVFFYAQRGVQPH